MEVSRLTILALVAGGVVVAVATGGDLSHFAGGFAAGAGAILMLSRARRRPEIGDGAPPSRDGISE